jgi:hypothetical protein
MNQQATPPTNYFFLCSYPLRVGSIVGPGNWGRMIRKYQAQVHSWPLTRELLFEMVRLREFPNKPSRLDSVFLCETAADASQFIANSNRPWDLMFRVHLVDSAAGLHRGCLSLLDPIQGENINGLSDRARQYWQGSNIQSPEVVTYSAVRVEEVL